MVQVSPRYRRNHGWNADGGWLRKTNTWYYLVLDVVGVMLGDFRGVMLESERLVLLIFLCSM